MHRTCELLTSDRTRDMDIDVVRMRDKKKKRASHKEATEYKSTDCPPNPSRDHRRPKKAKTIKREDDKYEVKKTNKKRAVSRYTQRLSDLDGIETEMLGSTDTACVRRRGARARGMDLVRGSISSIDTADRRCYAEQRVCPDNGMHVTVYSDRIRDEYIGPEIADDGIREISGVLHQRLVHSYHPPLHAVSVMTGNSTLMCKHVLYMQALMTTMTPAMLLSTGNKPSHVFRNAVETIKRIYPEHGSSTDEPRLSREGAKVLDTVMEMICAGDEGRARVLVRLMSKRDTMDYGHHQRTEQTERNARRDAAVRRKNMAKLMPVE